MHWFLKIMAGKKIEVSAFLILSLILTVNGSKLNVPRVLLPIFSDFTTKFTLEAVDGGCYKWTSTRSDVIKITPINQNIELQCSSKVDVSAITKEDARNIAVVLAEDVHTDQILKCNVIVDMIHSLSITTSTRELFMEEVPEAFQITAFDIQGNAFSTLVGVEFDWGITPLGPKKELTVLRYLAFKDSPYEIPPHIQKLEEDNKKGSMILLEGVKTGTAKVSVRLPYQEYKHVDSTEVILTVIANLLLTPAETYMMVGDTIGFKLFYMNNGRMDEIKLPDNQYYLEPENSDIVFSSQSTNQVVALKIGKTRIILHNKNINEDDSALKLPSGIINVVAPAYIVLSVMPHKNWAVLVGDQHEIFAEVFSSSDHKLHLGPGVEMQTTITDLFHIEERSRNDSWVAGWGLKDGKAPVKSTLFGAVHPKYGKFSLNTPLTSEEELYIYPRITISPPEVILPWDPQVKPRYSVDLIVKGGDGRFLWTSSDHSIGMVTQTGHVRTVSVGFFEVSAAMTRNHHNRQIAKISILPPTRLEIVEFVMEAEVGNPIYIHIALYAAQTNGDNATETDIPFTQCQELPFQVRLSDNKFVHNKTAVISPVGISCGNVAMIGTAVGTSKITISYYLDGVVLEDSVTINAYNPMKLLKPTSKVVLAVGSSINLIYTGGPRPQIGRQSDHQRTTITQHDDLVHAEDVTDHHTLPIEDATVIWVLCKKLGETPVKLLISNAPPVSNCKSHGSMISTKVICGKPRRIQLHPEIKVPDANGCPMDLSADRVVVPNNQDIELNVVVQDELGRVFLNFSSLTFDWAAKPPGAMKFHSESIINKYEMLGSVPLINKTQQIVRATVPNDLVEVKSSVTGYKLSTLKQFRITPEYPEFIAGDEKSMDLPSVSTTIGLFLVEDTVVSTNSVVVLNQPHLKKVVWVLHGSGYVELLLSADDIADVKYLESSKQIEITPIQSGELTIQVVDLCLVSNPVFVKVRVVTVGRIEIEMADMVEIHHCIEVIVRLFDETDQTLNLSEVGDIDLRFNFVNTIANLGKTDKEDKSPGSAGEIKYILTGVDLGHTQLTFSFNNNGHEIFSAPVDLHVFPPLKISPRNGTLLIGSTLQLTIRGGPQPDANIEFISLSKPIIEISDTGVVIGKGFGKTRITARAIGTHAKTGDKVIFSEDTIDMQVIKITDVKIAAPLTKIRVGSTIPCWVTGIPDQLSPLILASFEDSSISYDWYFSETDVATFHEVFASVGVVYKTFDRNAVRVTGLSPGKTRLKVKISINGQKVNRPTVLLTTFIDIEVFEALTIINPPAFAGKSLLMSQYSSIQLKTNLDDSSKIEFRLATNDIASFKNVSKTNRIVSLSESGLLESYGVHGYGMLLISATDSSGFKQILSYVVEVKPVHYMMLTVSAKWRIQLDSSLRVIPLGTEFNLLTSFFDNIGNKFNAGPRTVKVRSNRLDLIRIKQFPNNATIQVATRKPGHTVIKAWTDGPDNTADYIQIHAKEVVKPVVDYLTSGDMICMWSPVVTKQLQVGHWISSDPELVTIDNNTDIAFVVGNKEGTVWLTHPLHVHAPLFLHVLPVSNVTLLPELLKFITNGPGVWIYRIAVVLLNKNDSIDKKTNLLQGWHCDKSIFRHYVPTPFTCNAAFTNTSLELNANIIFNLKSIFQPQTGQYQCKLISSGVNASEASLLETNITVWAVSDKSEVSSEKIEIPFIPSVYSELEIIIGDDYTNAGTLEIKGLEKLLREIEVQPADGSIIYVDKGRFASPNLKRYHVVLIDYHSRFADSEDAMAILIKTPSLEQVLKVMVKVSKDYRDDHCVGRTSPLFRLVQTYKHSIIIVISMLVIFCITCFVYSRYMQPVVNVNVNPNRSLLAGSIGSTGNLGYQTSTPCNRTQQIITRLTPTSPICTNKMNCTCGQTREPVYGDVSSFTMNSPELRRNRRFL